MRIWEFTVILADGAELTEELGDALFAAGCDDASPGSCENVVAIDFDREAESLEAAIRSAVANVQAAGCTVKRVEIAIDNEVLRV